MEFLSIGIYQYTIIIFAHFFSGVHYEPSKNHQSGFNSKLHCVLLVQFNTTSEWSLVNSHGDIADTSNIYIVMVERCRF